VLAVLVLLLVLLLQCSAARLLRLSLMGACAQLSCAGSACPSMMQTAAAPPGARRAPVISSARRSVLWRSSTVLRQRGRKDVLGQLLD